MQVLSYIFTTLKWFGVWRPIEWSSEWKKNLYWIYTLLVILLLAFTPLTEIVYLIRFVKDADEIANSSFLFLTEACVIYKATNILNRRRDIIRFTASLSNDLGRPDGPEEMRIQKEFDKRIRQNTMLFDALVGWTIFFMYVVNCLKNVPQRTLSYNACFPFDHTTNIGYWIAYIYQVIAQGLSGILCVAYDTLFCGLMGQSCAQLRILQYRLQSIQHTILHNIENGKKLNNEPSVEEVEKRVLRRCICHHHDILQYTKSMNEVFGVVIFVQCAVSTFVLCCSIYMLSRMKPFSPEFTSMTGYMSCMLTEIFWYCWYGNEVMLESMDVRNAVYAMDWTKLKVRTQKNLLILMACTFKPIRFTSASIIVLSLDTYKRLLKLSYSMYNLLQQTTEK